MKKRKILLVPMFILLVWYVAMSYMELQFNLLLWDEIVRFVFVSGALVFCWFGTLIVWMLENV